MRNVLFLCTGNSARSIMAEAILAKDGAGRFRAYSAGSHPKGTVNPLALSTLASAGYPTDGLTSKAWEVFADPHAPKIDLVITVCDNAAGESCPVWPGHPAKDHWSIHDPAIDDSETAFRAAFDDLSARITALINSN